MSTPQNARQQEIMCWRRCGRKWEFACRYCGEPVCEECGSMPEGICNLCVERDEALQDGREAVR